MPSAPSAPAACRCRQPPERTECAVERGRVRPMPAARASRFNGGYRVEAWRGRRATLVTRRIALWRRAVVAGTIPAQSMDGVERRLPVFACGPGARRRRLRRGAAAADSPPPADRPRGLARTAAVRRRVAPAESRRQRVVRNAALATRAARGSLAGMAVRRQSPHGLACAADPAAASRRRATLAVAGATGRWRQLHRVRLSHAARGVAAAIVGFAQRRFTDGGVRRPRGIVG